MRLTVSLELHLEDQKDSAFGAIGTGFRKVVLDACEAGAEEARATHKYKDRSAQGLTASTKGYLTGWTAYSADGELVADKPYASFVNKGTKPHRIEARRRKSLRWEGEEGEVHFAKSVNHPGTKPDGFMDRGEAKAKQVLEAGAEALVERAQKDFT